MVWFYTLLSVLVVSLISLVGVFTLSLNQKKLGQWLIYLVSFSAGALMGDAFIHLIPEALENIPSRWASLFILSGILLFFVLEKIIHWRHCHEVACAEHPHAFSYMILLGDGVHNFIDGLVIGASFLVSFPVGLSTTLAVILHEIPQEIGDFGSLVYGGFSRLRALLYNFFSGTTAILGAVLILILGSRWGNLADWLVPFAAGGFIYIAGSDLIPELHKSKESKKMFFQVVYFILGIGVMFSLLILE